ncbi:unnamed protein product [[Candida] boidinii]|uniref:Unnamed protein product n=1 Tax=Candida boidinii TaxID=5477 RepID=A0A9W6T0C9_CANBO|nr:unnamed protein product [[Candida] boidinii]
MTLPAFVCFSSSFSLLVCISSSLACSNIAATDWETVFVNVFTLTAISPNEEVVDLTLFIIEFLEFTECIGFKLSYLLYSSTLIDLRSFSCCARSFASESKDDVSVISEPSVEYANESFERLASVGFAII